jgi:hypothetical protein
VWPPRYDHQEIWKLEVRDWRFEKTSSNTSALKLNRLAANLSNSCRRAKQRLWGDSAGFHQSRVTIHQSPLFSDVLGKFYGQAERAISMGQLRALLHFHLPPIKVVVFDRSS